MERITEGQFILISNLQRLRMAEEVVSHIYTTAKCPEIELKEVRKLLAVMRQRCQEIVEHE